MNILVVVHNYVGLGKSFGGVELTVSEILEAAAADSTSTNHYYLLSYDQRRKPTSDGHYVLIDMSQRNDDRIGVEVERFWVANPVALECYHDEDFASQFRQIILRFGIDIVHFHHLLHFPLNSPLVAQQAGALTVLSLHDYYALCPQWNLLQNYKKFCGFPEGVTLETCDGCLKEMFGYGAGTQNLRRQLLSEILNLADAVQYQSTDERSRFCQTYSFLADKEDLVIGSPLVQKPFEVRGEMLPLKVLPIVRSTAGDQTSLTRWASSSSSPLPVICLGNVAPEKGGDILVEVFRRCSENSSSRKFQFHLFGDVRPPFDKALAAVSKSGNLIIHGKYDRATLSDKLNGCSGVALFASNWPETWVRTLSESTACGLVPIAPRLGAFIERISDGTNGLLYEPASADSIIHALEEIAADPQKLGTMQRELGSIVCPTVEDNIQAFEGLYSRVFEACAEPDYARRRANRVARVFASSRPITWNMGERSGSDSGMPLMVHASAARRQSLLRRTWGVFRSRGLVYTIWATINYKKLRRAQ
jgi:glycosyltransferase involved in cell wall biosynthesis